MHALVRLVRECSTCTYKIATLSDEEIFGMLQTVVEGGMQLMDILIEIGCEVVVEELERMVDESGQRSYSRL